MPHAAPHDSLGTAPHHRLTRHGSPRRRMEKHRRWRGCARAPRARSGCAIVCIQLRIGHFIVVISGGWVAHASYTASPMSVPCAGSGIDTGQESGWGRRVMRLRSSASDAEFQSEFSIVRSRSGSGAPADRGRDRGCCSISWCPAFRLESKLREIDLKLRLGYQSTLPASDDQARTTVLHRFDLPLLVDCCFLLSVYRFLRLFIVNVYYLPFSVFHLLFTEC
ncbi:hypothetical protein BD779DRAFT_1519645, partial [Infundibulicybe gibba]